MIDNIKIEMEKVLVGQNRLIERMLIALLTDGHILLEGVPGLAKTTAVKTLAQALNAPFQRIQFTPDLIPGDLTGTDIFIPKEGDFRFVEGPLFHEVVLADEINRAPPKVQSALLEAMEERQITVGGTTRPLPPLFIVIATQNPIEQEGTYPLPEAQLDRFLFKHQLNYPSVEEELEILERDQAQKHQPDSAKQINMVASTEDILKAREAVNGIHMDDMLKRYLITLIQASRQPAQWNDELASWLQHGASPRASLALAHTAKARALLRKRDYVEPGDISDLAYDVLNHRISLSFSARAEGVNARDAVSRLLELVPIP